MSDGGSMCLYCGSLFVSLSKGKGECLNCGAKFSLQGKTEVWKYDENGVLKMVPKDLMWRCDICGEIRPDDKINVLVKKHDLSGTEMQENLKFCNDNPHCCQEIKYFSYIVGTETNRFELMDFEE